MLSLSPMKIFIIVAVVVILLGPDKLPDIAHKLGTSWQSLRRFQERVESEVRGALPDLPSTGDIARMARSPLSALNELADRASSATPQNDDDATTDATPSPTSSLFTPLVNPPSTPPPSTGSSSADPSLN